MKIVILLMLFSTSVYAGPLSKSSLRSKGCEQITQKMCKDISGTCIGVYVATSNASQRCKDLTPENIELVCGSKNAKIFDTGQECILNGKKGSESVKSINDLKQTDVEQLYTFTAIHKDACKLACGPRYDKTDIRGFGQVQGRPGLLCLDGSLDETKNGVKFSEDAMRKTCMEVHQGNFIWCTNYNRTYKDIDFGGFLICQGRIEAPR